MDKAREEHVLDDYALTRKLEVEIDELRESRDPAILALANEATTAIKKKQLLEAANLVREGQARVRPLTLGRHLVDAQHVQSMSQARRYVAQGAIMVDGKRAKDVSQDVKHATSITVRGRETI